MLFLHKFVIWGVIIVSGNDQNEFQLLVKPVDYRMFLMTEAGAAHPIMVLTIGPRTFECEYRGHIYGFEYKKYGYIINGEEQSGSPDRHLSEDEYREIAMMADSCMRASRKYINATKAKKSSQTPETNSKLDESGQTSFFTKEDQSASQ